MRPEHLARGAFEQWARVEGLTPGPGLDTSWESLHPENRAGWLAAVVWVAEQLESERK
jgi:hypothetical protein